MVKICDIVGKWHFHVEQIQFRNKTWTNQGAEKVETVSTSPWLCSSTSLTILLMLWPNLLKLLPTETSFNLQLQGKFTTKKWQNCWEYQLPDSLKLPPLILGLFLSHPEELLDLAILIDWLSQSVSADGATSANWERERRTL